MKFLVTLTIFLVFSFALVKCESEPNFDEAEAPIEEEAPLEEEAPQVEEEPKEEEHFEPTPELPKANGDECKGVKGQSFIPFPGSCHHFIHCAGQTPFVKSCGKELHFNKATLVCDYPERAGC